jgi:hypothetical protein
MGGTQCCIKIEIDPFKQPAHVQNQQANSTHPQGYATLTPISEYKITV